MDEMALLQNYLLVGAVLFGIGLAGFLVRRNMVVMFLCASIMLQGITLSLVELGRYHNDWGGQTLALFIIVVAVCEAGIMLALVLMLFRRTGRLDIADWQQLREEGERPFVDRELPEETMKDRSWPRQIPAGVQCEPGEEERLHQSHA
jgi:NADH-quinone oxidoreductase subunit K